MGEVRLKRWRSNSKIPTFLEMTRGIFNLPDIEEEEVLSAEDIEKMAILSAFNFSIPEKFMVTAVMLEINKVLNEMVRPVLGIHTPRVEVFLRCIETIRKNQVRGK